MKTQLIKMGRIQREHCPNRNLQHLMCVSEEEDYFPLSYSLPTLETREGSTI